MHDLKLCEFVRLSAEYNQEVVVTEALHAIYQLKLFASLGTQDLPFMMCKSMQMQISL